MLTESEQDINKYPAFNFIVRWKKMLDQLRVYFDKLLVEVQKLMDYINRILNIELL